MTTLKVTLQSSISENDSHLMKITRARSLLKEVFPLTSEAFLTLVDEKIELLDQFIFRFTKMQDSLGSRLIPSLYGLLEGQGKATPFLDILNKMEKMGFLTSVEVWQLFRNLRNNLAHDYPESLGQTVNTLNVLYEDFSKFQDLYEKLRQEATNRLNIL